MATDNPVLILHDGETNRVWNIDDLYTPGKDRGHVPQIKDLVYDLSDGWRRVTGVNPDTGIWTSVKWNPIPENPDTDVDKLIGVGPGTVSEHYRVFINDKVTPHVLSVDGGLHIYTESASYVKVFRGTDIGNSGQVISAMYDQQGNFVSENIPLTLAAMPDRSNVSIKAVASAFTNTKLNDGEIVAVVVYNAEAQPVYVNHLMVKNASIIRTTDASMKYIRELSLESPFLSPTDPSKLVYPINMPVENLNLMGKVTYSDGSTSRLPVDGTKFSIFGLDNFIATIEGMTIPLVLTYHLGDDEYNYIGEPTPERTISKQYSATTGKFDGAFSVKLFAYPVWISQAAGYALEYRLYTGDREDYYNVTNLVQMTSESREFDPILYGVKQKIAVAINLRSVDTRFANYRHVQTFEVTLRARGDDATQDNWTVGFSSNQNPPYGQGMVAAARFINTGNWELDLSCGCQTLEEWLDRVFYRTEPLFDPTMEARAPAPNVFVVQVGNHQIEVPISMWNTLITAHEMPAEGKLIYLHFAKRNSTTDLQLGVSGLIVHQIPQT